MVEVIERAEAHCLVPGLVVRRVSDSYEAWESGGVGMRKGLSWEDVVAACREWAGYVRVELETPDFWAQPRPES